jgi:hypothetical protein
MRRSPLTDHELIAKAGRILAMLRPEHGNVSEFEVMAALRSILTEPELAHLLVLGLEALVDQTEDGEAPP